MPAHLALSPRERQVLDLREAGRSLQSIAGELGLNYDTARGHLHRARLKLAEPATHAPPASYRRLRVVPTGYTAADVERLCRILDACAYDPEA